MSTRLCALVALFVFVQAAPALAQDQADGPAYQVPPQAILDVLDAEPLPEVATSPSRDVIALLPRRSMPSIAELAMPMLPLAGTRVNPATNGPQRAPAGTGITFRDITTGAERRVQVPEGAHVAFLGFSPDGRRFAFTNTTGTRVDLYVGDVTTAETRRVDAALNPLVGGCDWLNDSASLLCTFVPPGRGPAPGLPAAPAGPNVQENFGAPGPIPTYQDLLASAHDEALFEYHFTSELAFVDAATGRRTIVGLPGLVTAAAAPGGEYLLITRIKRPFSRLLTWGGFPQDIEIWNRGGERLRTIADVPTRDAVPINGVITGPRSVRWAPLDPATLVWVEALDGGDLRNSVPHRDRVLTLIPPFTGTPMEVARTEYRYGGASWTEEGLILLTENDRDTRTTRTWVMSANWTEPRKLWDRPQQDSYGNPGSPVFRPGTGAILQDGDAIYLTGAGASPDGDLPFLDRLDLENFATERLFRSDTESYETVVGLLDDGATRVITRRETRTNPPNYFVRDLGAGTMQAVTDFADPHPEITQAMADRRFVTYAREDGLPLSGTIYLPAGYEEGDRVPMLVWAYPREFVDPGAAGQVVGSPNRYTPVTGASHLLFLTQGYAIFDGPSMPIVGPGETANDQYVEQLVSSARAAVDHAVELGIADRDRVAVGGHSYGAFMTANLLAHSDLFRAGIARSGAYNRSLTPFGFQSERRTFWEVPDVYGNMSPFYHADKIDEPILLIHGEADNNSGTFPIQSERLYMALKGHGATARYVTLPHEAHGYAARESNLHVLWETLTWLDTYVKNAPPSRPPLALQ
ncbi:MAG: prolyl oligopeptidase family serine peptidase [Gemmatimonadota bacterium]